MRDENLEQKIRSVHDDMEANMRSLNESRRLAYLGIVLAVLALALCLGCQFGTDIILNQTVEFPAPSPSPAASPVPGVLLPSGAPFDSVTVEVFEHVFCADPPTGNRLRIGCLTRITATPKVGTIEVPPAVHGDRCDWFLDGQRVEGQASSAVVQIGLTMNPFNIVARGIAAGTFTLEAEVRQVRSGARRFVVE